MLKNINACQFCWWKEGGRCYSGNPKRLKNGLSTKFAKSTCNKYWNKRSALETIIPSDRLIILSEKL